MSHQLSMQNLQQCVPADKVSGSCLQQSFSGNYVLSERSLLPTCTVGHPWISVHVLQIFNLPDPPSSHVIDIHVLGEENELFGFFNSELVS